jgi:hypothetical protein
MQILAASLPSREHLPKRRAGPPCCQVETCQVNLETSKEYYVRYLIVSSPLKLVITTFVLIPDYSYARQDMILRQCHGFFCDRKVLNSHSTRKRCEGLNVFPAQTDSSHAPASFEGAHGGLLRSTQEGMFCDSDSWPERYIRGRLSGGGENEVQWNMRTCSTGIELARPYCTAPQSTVIP